MTQKTKLQEQVEAKTDMLEAQARAMLLEEKLKMTRERLNGLKNFPTQSYSEDSRSESAGSASEESTNEDETQES